MQLKTKSKSMLPVVEEVVQRVTEKAFLSGPKPIFNYHVESSCTVSPCSLKLPSRILEASGLKANDEVQLIAGEGEITIRYIADGQPFVTGYDRSPKNPLLDVLMAFSKEREDEMRRRQSGEEEATKQVDDEGKEAA